MGTNSHFFSIVLLNKLRELHSDDVDNDDVAEKDDSHGGDDNCRVCMQGSLHVFLL